MTLGILELLFYSTFSERVFESFWIPSGLFMSYILVDEGSSLTLPLSLSAICLDFLSTYCVPCIYARIHLTPNRQDPEISSLWYHSLLFALVQSTIGCSSSRSEAFSRSPWSQRLSRTLISPTSKAQQLLIKGISKQSLSRQPSRRIVCTTRKWVRLR